MSAPDACPDCGARMTCRSCSWSPGPFGGLCRLPDAKPLLVSPETAACAAFSSAAAPSRGDVAPTTSSSADGASLAITVWAWDDAPEDLRALSPHGGDEDWIVVLPPGWLKHYGRWLTTSRTSHSRS